MILRLEVATAPRSCGNVAKSPEKPPQLIGNWLISDTFESRAVMEDK